MERQIECCANCRYMLEYPRNNQYRDVDYLCAATGYFVHGIHKNRKEVKSYSPGGKKLVCKYKKKEETQVRESKT